jgi:hypothetical protein
MATPHQLNRLCCMPWKVAGLDRDSGTSPLLVPVLEQKSQALAVPIEALLELDLDFLVVTGRLRGHFSWEARFRRRTWGGLRERESRGSRAVRSALKMWTCVGVYRLGVYERLSRLAAHGVVDLRRTCQPVYLRLAFGRSLYR